MKTIDASLSKPFGLSSLLPITGVSPALLKCKGNSQKLWHGARTALSARLECWQKHADKAVRAPNFQELFLALFLFAGMFALPASAVTPGRTFSSPEEAAKALADAASAKDKSALKAIFGPASEEIRASDPVQADHELEAFTDAYNATNRVVRETDSHASLIIGTNHWRFPVPVVQNAGNWFFDTEAGKEEIINRRIGRNELSAINTARAYAQAQREYASRDRDGDQVLEYAQHIVSAPGAKDGLYWSPELDGELSPLGPLVAAAHGEGYRKSTGEKSGPRPFHGYCFKIITGQAANAPGGRYSYIINDNMIGGFALVAWPAEYGDSGVMTFIVNQQGKVFQKDLGPRTAALAQETKEYSPGGWKLSPD